MAARSVNKVILLGRIGRDAETKFTSGGTAKSTFSLATTKRYKDQSGEWREQTDWHNIVLWKMEKVAEFLTKGKQVYIEGELTTRSYEKNGEKKYVTEVVARDVILLGGDSAARPAQAKPSAPAEYLADDEDVPF